MVGDFTTFNGQIHGRIVRLKGTSTATIAEQDDIDPAANFGTGANAVVNAAVIQNDGKILVAGAFTSVNGVAVNRLARLEAGLNTDNGTLQFSQANYAVNESSSSVMVSMVRSGGLNGVVGVDRATSERTFAQVAVSDAANTIAVSGFLRSTERWCVWPRRARCRRRSVRTRTTISWDPRAEWVAHSVWLPPPAEVAIDLTDTGSGATSALPGDCWRALPLVDYLPVASATTTFQPGQVIATFDVTILKNLDPTPEGNRTVSLSISGNTVAPPWGRRPPPSLIFWMTTACLATR